MKDIVKLAISFTVVKNITAENGERTIYIRITKPDNDALTKSASNTFSYENRTLTYSIKKYIEYNGEEQNVNVFGMWKSFCMPETIVWISSRAEI